MEPPIPALLLSPVRLINLSAVLFGERIDADTTETGSSWR
jgi:hypothetical protein